MEDQPPRLERSPRPSDRGVVTPGRMAAGTLLLVALAVLGYACAHAPVLPELPQADMAAAIRYRDDVAPVLESRCVACHSCYDAPCQLLASSYEGRDGAGCDTEGSL